MTEIIAGIDYKRIRTAVADFMADLYPIDVGNFKSYFTTSAVRAYNNDILLFARCGDTHSFDKGHIRLFISSDDGISWKDKGIIASDAQYDVRNPIAGVTATGRILLFYWKHAYPNSGLTQPALGGFMRYSDNNGLTWTNEVEQATIGITRQAGAFSIQDSVGNIILNPRNSDILYAVDGEDGSSFKTFALYKSTYASNGETWTKVANILDITGSPSEIYEPSLMYLRDRLFCSIRRQNPGEAVGLVYSDDDGATWSAPVFYPEFSPFVGPYNCLFSIPGGLAWVIRYYRGHKRINLFVSRDGLFWFRNKELLDLPYSFGSGYVSMVPLLNGKSLLMFPVEHFPPGNFAATITNSLAGLYARPLNLTDIGATGKGRYPIYRTASLAAGATSSLADCHPVHLESMSTLAITGECTYHSAATAGLRLHLRASSDGNVFDTLDWDRWDLDFSAGATVRKTMNQNPFPLVLKVLVENLDGTHPVTDITIQATIGR